MKDMFARHGIRERLIADNMPFNSLKFKNFASEREIEVVTSSLHYPSSNGLIERNKQTIKQLLKKVDGSKQDAFLALLEFHSSPISGMKESPAELLTSRKLRTRPPTPKYLLQPMPSPPAVAVPSTKSEKLLWPWYPALPELHQGEAVRIQQEQNRLWFLNNMWLLVPI